VLEAGIIIEKKHGPVLIIGGFVLGALRGVFDQGRRERRKETQRKRRSYHYYYRNGVRAEKRENKGRDRQERGHITVGQGETITFEVTKKRIYAARGIGSETGKEGAGQAFLHWGKKGSLVDEQFLHEKKKRHKAWADELFEEVERYEKEGDSKRLDG